MNESSDLLAWLEKEPHYPKFCWSGPDKTFAAVGARGVHRTMPKEFAYAVISFEGERTFIEPQVMREGSLICGGEGVDLEPIDSFEQWQKRFDAARAAPYEKVVISRRLRGECLSPFNAFRSMDFGAGIAFFYMPDQHQAFFGVSPERLFELENGVVQVDAVAGTRPLTGEPHLDERYARELLFSPKERYEHSLVTEHVEKVLGFTPGEIFIRESGPVQHLCQEFIGDTSMSSLELLEKLHPTPAVAGAPIEVIRQIEGFDRGLYAGPIGIVDGENAFFAVAIRSGLWKGTEKSREKSGELTWYSGCGITEGSDCLAEWNETERKSKVMRCERILT